MSRAPDADSEATVDRILAAARACLDRDGPEGLTLRAVAAEAGSGLGAITYYFDDRASLLEACLDEGYAELTRTLAATLAAATGDPVDALARALTRLSLRRPGLAQLRYLNSSAQGRLPRDRLDETLPWLSRIAALAPKLTDAEARLSGHSLSVLFVRYGAHPRRERARIAGLDEAAVDGAVEEHLARVATRLFAGPTSDPHEGEVQARATALPVSDKIARTLAAARRALTRRGPVLLSMRAIAQDAGVGLGTVSRAFGGRRGLLEACLDDAYREVMSLLLAAFVRVAAGRDPTAGAQDVVRALIRLGWQKPELARARIHGSMVEGRIPERRMMENLLPALSQTERVFGGLVGATEARLSMHSISVLLLRYAMHRPDELRRVTGAHTVEGARVEVEAHLLRLTGLLMAP